MDGEGIRTFTVVTAALQAVRLTHAQPVHRQSWSSVKESNLRGSVCSRVHSRSANGTWCRGKDWLLWRTLLAGILPGQLHQSQQARITRRPRRQAHGAHGEELIALRARHSEQSVCRILVRSASCPSPCPPCACLRGLRVILACWLSCGCPRPLRAGGIVQPRSPEHATDFAIRAKGFEPPRPHLQCGALPD